jgi:PIN like domain
VKSARVRFYFDADILGLGKLVARLRSDCTYPGDPGFLVHKRERPACLVDSPAVKDQTWIPVVAAQGWVIITRDSRIQSQAAEIAAVRDNGARMVALSGQDAKSTWHQLEIFMTHWRRIEALADLPGPFVYTASRSGLRQKDLA